LIAAAEELPSRQVAGIELPTKSNVILGETLSITRSYSILAAMMPLKASLCGLPRMAVFVRGFSSKQHKRPQTLITTAFPGDLALNCKDEILLWCLHSVYTNVSVYTVLHSSTNVYFRAVYMSTFSKENRNGKTDGKFLEEDRAS